MKHQCKEIDKLEDIGSFSITIARDRPEEDATSAWCLVYQTYASEADVAMKEAEQIGEVLRAVELAITYCPYCGAKLGIA